MEKSFFGIVSLTNLQNVWLTTDINVDNTESDVFLTEGSIKIVHYPDCQQLIIWLPTYWDSYVDMSISTPPSGTVIWRKEIREIINGSIQIILDTLPFPPGDMSIKIAKIDGLQHIIHLKKYEEGVFPDTRSSVPEIVPDNDKAPIIYRDGFGNILPNQDLLMREQFMKDLVRKFSRKVEFENMGRSNNVIYKDGEKSFSFWSEFGSGDCLFYIGIPTTETWEKQTGFSLAERDEIIQFVAEETLRAQTVSSSSFFEIEDRWIYFYKDPQKKSI
ncbi:MAG: hypothetical protein WAU01_08840 [Saprospiraceae bacterium]